MLPVEYSAVEVIFHIVVVVAGVALRYPFYGYAIHVETRSEYWCRSVRLARLVVVRMLHRLVGWHVDVTVGRSVTVGIASVHVSAGAARKC